MVGTLQATEAIKLILGIGEPLIGRMVHFDALKMKFREFNLRRDPECPVCGDHPTIVAPIDYDTFRQSGPDPTSAVPQIDVRALRERMDSGEPFILLDVREPFEFEIARIDGANLIPLGDLPRRWRELDREKETFVYCHSGMRSAQAAEFLRSAGLARVANVAGGIDAWSQEVDPAVPRY
jgi:rhodanese-related sulfurtransferase